MTGGSRTFDHIAPKGRPGGARPAPRPPKGAAGGPRRGPPLTPPGGGGRAPPGPPGPPAGGASAPGGRGGPPQKPGFSLAHHPRTLKKGPPAPIIYKALVSLCKKRFWGQNPRFWPFLAKSGFLGGFGAVFAIKRYYTIL